MAKKLLTKDQKLISEVENVLKIQKVEYVKYNVGDNGTIIAVLNRDGETLNKAVKETNTTSQYYLGTLRGHYYVPQNLLTELNKEV